MTGRSGQRRGARSLRQLGALSPQDEKDRRERWLDAFQAALDRDYPGFSAAVVERMFLNARSMANFMNTPDGAIYGFAPLPFERGFWSGVPRLAEDAVARRLSRFVLRRQRRLQRGDAVRRGRRADGDEGAGALERLVAVSRAELSLLSAEQGTFVP